jgi:hypothetical protein
MHREQPKFLGIALERERHILYAAGPMGLYAFTPDGESVGRMLFDEPVSGVALTKSYIYLIVGHMLCRIPFPRLAEQEQKIKNYTSDPAQFSFKPADHCTLSELEKHKRLRQPKKKRRRKECTCAVGRADHERKPAPLFVDDSCNDRIPQRRTQWRKF